MLNKELLEQKLGKSIQEAGEKEIYFMLLELVKEMAKDRERAEGKEDLLCFSRVSDWQASFQQSD